jgi:RND superfamily putative drug exporter
VSKLLTIASGRRAKWMVGAVWLVVIMAMGAAQLPAKFADAQENESSSFLPGDAESTKALTASEDLQGGETAASIVIYRRETGLTAADKQRIQDDRERYNADLPRATGPLGEPVFSPDGKAAIVQSVITGDGESDTILGRRATRPTRSRSSSRSTARSCSRRWRS